ncbi:MAG: class I SAM-dependent methyltransferase [Planctomycetes bacterium]|nr:class I SAM-dependent methyltransferase [Planctomycetota bacterium]
MKNLRRWMNWQLEKVLPDPKQSFQRIEPDRVLFEEIDWSPRERVLDVGCYRGHYMNAIAPRVRSVIGIDLSLGDIPRGTPCICGDGQLLPFADGSFNSILCHMTANLFPRPDAAAREFVRCCTPNGRIIVTVCNLHAPYQRVNATLERLWPRCDWATLRTSQNRWTARQWCDAIQSCGASLERTYSCNLCWPLVPRLRGRWIIPNRVMHSWNQTIRRASRLPLQTTQPHFAAHDYVLVFRKDASPGAAPRD